jgi:DNA polymerase III alpha subunit
MNEISPPNVGSPRIGQAYVELAAASNFSFLRGASHAEELVVQASRLGLGGIAITDRNSLAGVVRGHMAAKEAGLAFATGCRLVFMDGTPDILVWPEDRAAWGNLCELLTTGKRRAPKGECHLTLEDLLTHGQGLLMAVVAPAGAAGPQLEPVLRQLREAFPDHLHLACRVPMAALTSAIWQALPGWRGSMICRWWRSATCSTTRPNAGRCRMC